MDDIVQAAFVGSGLWTVCTPRRAVGRVFLRQTGPDRVVHADPIRAPRPVRQGWPDAAIERWEQLDVLVDNAGVARIMPLATPPPKASMSYSAVPCRAQRAGARGLPHLAAAPGDGARPFLRPDGRVHPPGAHHRPHRLTPRRVAGIRWAGHPAGPPDEDLKFHK